MSAQLEDLILACDLRAHELTWTPAATLGPW